MKVLIKVFPTRPDPTRWQWNNPPPYPGHGKGTVSQMLTSFWAHQTGDRPTQRLTQSTQTPKKNCKLRHHHRPRNLKRQSFAKHNQQSFSTKSVRHELNHYRAVLIASPLITTAESDKPPLRTPSSRRHVKAHPPRRGHLWLYPAPGEYSVLAVRQLISLLNRLLTSPSSFAQLAAGTGETCINPETSHTKAGITCVREHHRSWRIVSALDLPPCTGPPDSVRFCLRCISRRAVFPSYFPLRFCHAQRMASHLTAGCGWIAEGHH